MFGRMDFNRFITVQIEATENLQYLYYQVIGRGGVVASHKVNARNSKVFTFRFWATFAMVPKAQLIVYYYRPNGEIILERVDLQLENRLGNYVSIDLFGQRSG
jgi:CD109 antigen